MQVPEDAVDQRAMVLPRATGLAVVVAVREEGCDPLPLDVGKVKAVHGWPPSGNLPSREKGSTFIIRSVPIVRNDLGYIVISQKNNAYDGSIQVRQGKERGYPLPKK